MYTEEQLSMSLLKVGAGASDNLAVADVASYSYAVMEQCCVRRLYAMISVAVVSGGTDAVIEFKRRPTFGSAVGEVSLGTLTIPDASAVSDVIYKDISPVSLVPGDELVFEVTTAAGTSGEALYGVRADLDPEDANNQSNLVESA